MAVTHPTPVRNQMADLVVDLIDAGAGAGQLKITTSADAEVATLVFSDPAFGSAASGTATANTINDDTDATGGTAAKLEIEDSAAVDVVFGSVSATGGGGDLELSSVAIAAGENVSVTSLDYTAPA